MQEVTTGFTAKNKLFKKRILNRGGKGGGELISIALTNYLTLANVVGLQTSKAEWTAPVTKGPAGAS